MGVNKVEFDGQTLVDLTGDTVTADTLEEGVTAHDAAGNLITGHAGKITIDPTLTQEGQAADAKAVGDALANKEASGTAASTVNTRLNRTNAVNVANTNYTTYMARGEALFAAETTPTVNGAIAWQYE